MFTVKTDKYSDKQLRHISFIAQFVQQVEHIQGDKNVVPDALSRIETVTLDAQLPDATTLSKDQAEDPELQRILSDTLDGAQYRQRLGLFRHLSTRQVTYIRSGDAFLTFYTINLIPGLEPRSL